MQIVSLSNVNPPPLSIKSVSILFIVCVFAPFFLGIIGWDLIRILPLSHKVFHIRNISIFYSNLESTYL